MTEMHSTTGTVFNGSVTGMTCASCVRRVESALLDVEGVTIASVSLITNSAIIEVDEVAGDTEDALTAAIKQIGYELEFPSGESRFSWLESVFRRQDKEIAILRFRTFIGVLTALPILIFMCSRLFFSFEIIDPSVRFFDVKANLFVSFVLASISISWVAAPIHAATWRSLKNRSADMNTLITLGITTAYVYSVIVILKPSLFALEQNSNQALYFDAVVLVVFFLWLGRFLEARARYNAGEMLRNLVSTYPETAQVIESDNSEFQIPAKAVRTGEIVIVRAGERVPVDGQIIEGKTSVDESMVTGESEPVARGVGDVLIGGSQNIDGTVKIKATTVGESSIYSNIAQLVERAQASKAPIQELADRLASIFVPAVLCLALLTFFGWWSFGPANAFTYAIINAATVLVVACPCALGLATPAAIAMSVSQAAKSGILISDAGVFENLTRTTKLLFDKTGTLTHGTPRVTEIIMSPDSAFSEEELIFMIASAERGSNHPHATAMFDIARDRGIELAWPLTFRALQGNGIIAELNRHDEEYQVVIGNSALLLSEDISLSNLDVIFKEYVTNGLTPIFLAVNGRAVGIFGLEDPIRGDAKSVIHELRQFSVVPVMLSGDIASVTDLVAQKVGIDLVFSEVSPAEKHQIVSAEQESEIGLVAMIGDGINDAPALAQADVGISMMNSSDLAQSSAIVNFLRPDLAGLLYLLKLSHGTIRIMRQNLGWAFIYNLVLLPIAMGAGYVVAQLFFGDVEVPKLLSIIFSENWFLNPAAAGAAMAFSSLSVILNSLRLGWLQTNY